MKVFLLTLFFSLSVLGYTITLNEKNMVSIEGKIDDVSMSQAKNDLEKLVSVRGMQFYTIYIVIRSGGGGLGPGFGFIDYASKIPLLETISIDTFSMASHIANALPGKRWGTPLCIIGFHEGTLLLEPFIPPRATRFEIKKLLTTYEEAFDRFEKTNYTRMKLLKEEYIANVHGKDWVLKSEQAVAARAIDEIADVVCDASLKNKKTTKMIATPFGISIPEEVSACPL